MKAQVLAIVMCGAVALAAQGQQAATAPIVHESEEPAAQKRPEVKPEPIAWRVDETLGHRYRVPMDTLLLNFYRKDIAISPSPSWATTGNIGAPAWNDIYFDRPEADLYFFKEAFYHWLRRPANFEWYNTRLPFTQVAYHSGSSGDTGQDDLSATFSANVNKRIQVGAGVNLVTGRGQYSNQADREFSYRIFGSYMGDRYQVQAAFNNYNFVTEENGGIVDDNYILDPGSLQGGDNNINAQSIPVNLSSAYNRLRGRDLFVTHRYNLGHYYEEVIDDTTTVERFVPVSSIIHTLKYADAHHRFVNEQASQDTTYFDNTYLQATGTNEISGYWALTNTVGMALHEGFSKWAKMGVAAYATYEVRHYTQITDTIAPGSLIAPHLSVHPLYEITPTTTEHALWVGGQLWKRQGSWLTYEVDGKVGLVGPVLGDIDIKGHIGTAIPLWNDTLSIKAQALFKNSEPSHFLKEYTSNHFIWKNNFGKTRRLRVGGEISFPKTGTYISAGFENIQNYIYFDENCMPRQESGNIQVISARLRQQLALGIFHLDAEGVYQFTSNDKVLPLPTFSVYGNLYLLFPVVKVMQIQIGVDCRWYTAYHAPAYQPALLTRYNQNEVEIGNYPFMNAYVNVKLKKARFYVLYSHMNQGWLGGSNYFSIPHYPLNPAIFQFGVAVDFAN